jgi:hypothetical protein
MIADFRWQPSRYEFETRLIPDPKTRCGVLFLHKFAEVNKFGETRQEVEGEDEQEYREAIPRTFACHMCRQNAQRAI